MDETLWALANILGPLILLGAFIYVVMRTRRSRAERGPAATDSTERTEAATHHIYEVEEQRRRDGTDGL
jgi:hypothetical protein